MSECSPDRFGSFCQAIDSDTDEVRKAVERIRRSCGLPPLFSPAVKKRCFACDGSGFIEVGTDSQGYHWSVRCPRCNPSGSWIKTPPDPPAGDDGDDT